MNLEIVLNYEYNDIDKLIIKNIFNFVINFLFFGLGIEVEILFVSNEQKDWNVKPGLQASLKTFISIFLTQ